MGSQVLYISKRGEGGWEREGRKWRGKVESGRKGEGRDATHPYEKFIATQLVSGSDLGR